MLADQPYEVFNKTPLTCFEGICGSKLYLVHTMPEFWAFYEILMKRPRVACDTETSGFRWFASDRICGMSFGWGQDNFYLPVRHKASVLGGEPPPQLDMGELRPHLQAFFSRKDLIAIFHNRLFDQHMYKADQIDFRCACHDTFHMLRQWDENAPGALKDVSSGWVDSLGAWHKGLVHKSANADEKQISEWRGLEARARKKLYSDAVKDKVKELASEIRFQGYKKNDIKKHVQEYELLNHPYREVEKNDITYDYVPVVDMTKYAALDTFLTYKAYEFLLPKIKGKQAEIYKNELKLADAIFDAEEHGVFVDIPYLQEVETKFNKELEEKRVAICEKLGKVNVCKKKATKTKPAVYEEVYPKLDGDQLIQALLNNSITLTETTKEGKYKTDKKVLTKLSRTYPICKEILDYRKQKKLQTTYIGNVIKASVDGRLHSSFNQGKAKTGRMSSSGGVNLQNLPNKDKTVRKAFLAAYNDDYRAFYMDYSQIEMRLTAHYSEEPALLEVYEKGQDVHLKIACGMFGVPYVEAKSIHENEDHARWKEINEMRQVGKIIGFSSVYQVSPQGLAEQIPRPSRYAQLTHEEWVLVCAEFLQNFFDAHRGVKKFVIRSNRFVRLNGYMETSFGRIRHLPEYNAVKVTGDRQNSWMESAAQRQGTNFRIQGEAADIFKFSVVRVHKLLKGTKSIMFNWVHDDTNFYIHRDDVHLIPKIKAVMEDWNYKVPLKVDVSWSKTNWADKRSIDGNNIEALKALWD